MSTTRTVYVFYGIGLSLEDLRTKGLKNHEYDDEFEEQVENFTVLCQANGCNLLHIGKWSEPEFYLAVKESTISFEPGYDDFESTTLCSDPSRFHACAEKALKETGLLKFAMSPRPAWKVVLDVN
jgi:hypothetical protein